MFCRLVCHTGCEVFGHASVAITGDVDGHVSPDVSLEALTRLGDALACKKAVKRWSTAKTIMKHGYFESTNLLFD
jgi:hypothetical protein